MELDKTKYLNYFKGKYHNNYKNNINLNTFRKYKLNKENSTFSFNDCISPKIKNKEKKENKLSMDKLFSNFKRSNKYYYTNNMKENHPKIKNFLININKDESPKIIFKNEKLKELNIKIKENSINNNNNLYNDYKNNFTNKNNKTITISFSSNREERIKGLLIVNKINIATVRSKLCDTNKKRKKDKKILKEKIKTNKVIDIKLPKIKINNIIHDYTYTEDIINRINCKNI